MVSIPIDANLSISWFTSAILSHIIHSSLKPYICLWIACPRTVIIFKDIRRFNIYFNQRRRNRGPARGANTPPLLKLRRLHFADSHWKSRMLLLRMPQPPFLNCFLSRWLQPTSVYGKTMIIDEINRKLFRIKIRIVTNDIYIGAN